MESLPATTTDLFALHSEFVRGLAATARQDQTRATVRQRSLASLQAPYGIHYSFRDARSTHVAPPHRALTAHAPESSPCSRRGPSAKTRNSLLCLRAVRAGSSDQCACASSRCPAARPNASRFQIG